MPCRTPFLCRICADLAANLLFLHIGAGDVQEVYEIFIYIKQILRLEFESLRAHHRFSCPRTLSCGLWFDATIRTPGRQQGSSTTWPSSAKLIARRATPKG